MKVFLWFLGPGPGEGRGHLWPRWLFLRALGLIFLSAFYSLLFQVQGLIGPLGILPAGEYLQRVSRGLGTLGYWYAPTVLWLGSGPRALDALCWAGMAAALLLVFNIWPRASLATCLVAFVSFVSAAQDFSSYQSDGMLLASGFLCLFFAPPGLRPGLGTNHPPSRASLFLLQWEWFRIYFESGIVKMASHDPDWRHLTALDHYYENGPLPDWIGWYAQQLPHRVHAATALFTLIAELGLVWMLFLRRRYRLLCFLIVTPFQVGIILTANLAFLNYLVLSLGILLLDDESLDAWARFLRRLPGRESKEEVDRAPSLPTHSIEVNSPDFAPQAQSAWRAMLTRVGLMKQWVSLFISAIVFLWIFYATTFLLLAELEPALPLPTAPVVALEPFRIANQYGLFAVMTTARYEIEFQGSSDGQNWIPFPFCFKPQDLGQPPGLFAPYQPRFDWNLWFASLGPWQQSPFVVRTEELLLTNNRSVLSLFAGNPFEGEPPQFVRAVLWRYWFTDLATKRRTGLWWNRKLLGLYAPAIERRADGTQVVVKWPEKRLPPE